MYTKFYILKHDLIYLKHKALSSIYSTIELVPNTTLRFNFNFQKLVFSNIYLLANYLFYILPNAVYILVTGVLLLGFVVRKLQYSCNWI